MEKIKTAKLCYEHIGGKLGQLLLERFLEEGWLAKESPLQKNLYITQKGIAAFANLGIDLSQLNY